MELTTVAPFSLVSAFTTNAFGGNPAAVVFLDPSLPLDYLGKISQNFNQPMLSVVSPTSLPCEDDKILVRTIRFIVPNGQEVPICDHGTLAAAKAVFALSEVALSAVDTIHFRNVFGNTLTAFKLEGGFIEIRLPSTVPGYVPDDEKAKLKPFINKAFRRGVKIKDIKTGGSVYETYVLTELDESENLGGSLIDAKALIGNGYEVNIFTSVSSNTNEEFISRVFSPIMLGADGEDPVCGSAHAVLAPYWYSKRSLASGTETKARQVSPRGGDLRIVLDEAEKIVRLRGQSVIFATGELRL